MNAHMYEPHQAQTHLDLDGRQASKVATVVIIEKRTLIRECIALALRASSDYEVLALADVNEWLVRANEISACLVVLSSPIPTQWSELERCVTHQRQSSGTPVAIVADWEEPEQVAKALAIGARGVVPTDTPVEVLVSAFRLIEAGGVFVPISSLVSIGKDNRSCAPYQLGNQSFTARQAAVIEALRRGKANKIIAYELNMRESTVKVHVRNIMKKLKARNRTEVAFMVNSIPSYSPIQRGEGVLDRKE